MDRLEKALQLAAGEERCSRVKRELDYIDTMLKAASEYGLEAEVVWAFYDCVRQTPGIDIGQATFEALAEWDL